MISDPPSDVTLWKYHTPKRCIYIRTVFCKLLNRWNNMQALLGPSISELVLRFWVFRAHDSKGNDVQASDEPGAGTYAAGKANLAVEEIVEHDGVQEPAERRARDGDAHCDGAFMRRGEVLGEDSKGWDIRESRS